jgi:membrane protease YdiL (CAAX protease family)
MSNALSASVAALAPVAGAMAEVPSTLPSTTNPAEWGAFSSVAVTLIPLGACTLAVWVVRRLARPAKLSLSRTPGRRNSLNPAHILLSLAMWLLSAAAARRALARVLQADSHELLVLAGIISQVVWLLSSLVLAAMAFNHGLRRGLGLSMRHWLYDTGRGVLGYLAIYPVFFGLVWAVTALSGPPQEHEMLKALRATGPGWAVAGMISAVVLAPLAEETFSRGLLQSMLRRYTRRPWAAIFLAAGAFALLHYPYWQHMPALFALAVAIGYNYERCGRLYPAFLIHGLFNAVNVAISLTAMR